MVGEYVNDHLFLGDTSKQISGHRKFMLASQIFPGPHSQTSAWSSTEMELVTTETNNLEEAVITGWS